MIRAIVCFIRDLGKAIARANEVDAKLKYWDRSTIFCNEENERKG